MTTKQGRFLISLLTAITVLAAAEPAAAGTAVPRLVVNILVDGLRSDYVQAFMPLYGPDGFRRLMGQGLVYSQAENPSAWADHAATAATISTGTTPSDHGIIGLRWTDRKTLRPVFCTGTNDSPQYLSVSTLGDEMKIATNGRALVYSIAPFKECAILTGGHSTDATVWMDARTGRWTTSAYFGTLPSWVRAENNQTLPTLWKPLNELVGNFNYFPSGGMKKPFAHKLTANQLPTSGLVNEMVARLASTAINGSILGQDEISDLLSLTFYAGGKPSMELQDTYVRLDRSLAELLQVIDRRIGLQNTLIALTSTGTSEEDEEEDLHKYNVPTGAFDMKRSASLLNMYLAAVYGQGNYVEACYGRQIYLNRKFIENKQINLGELLERCQDFLLQLDGVKDVYTSQRLIQGAWTPGISKIRNGYNACTSGDILIEVAPGWRYTNTDDQKNQQVRATYIPFPIIFFGYGITHEEITTPVTIDYIAPTLSKAIRIRAPNGCKLQPLK